MKIIANKGWKPIAVLSILFIIGIMLFVATCTDLSKTVFRAVMTRVYKAEEKGLEWKVDIGYVFIIPTATRHLFSGTTYIYDLNLYKNNNSKLWSKWMNLERTIVQKPADVYGIIFEQFPQIFWKDGDYIYIGYATDIAYAPPSEEIIPDQYVITICKIEPQTKLVVKKRKFGLGYAYHIYDNNNINNIIKYGEHTLIVFYDYFGQENAIIKILNINNDLSGDIGCFIIENADIEYDHDYKKNWMLSSELEGSYLKINWTDIQNSQHEKLVDLNKAVYADCSINDK